MKLFLTSSAIGDKHIKELLRLTNKIDISDLKFTLIENAADVYSEDRKWFIYEMREVFSWFWINYDFLDLRDYIWKLDSLREQIIYSDIVWIWGWNTYYLMDILNKVNFANLKPDFIENDIVYAGWSAGSIASCPSILGYEIVDDSSVIEGSISNWLDWFPKQIIPHWNHPKYKLKLWGIADDFTLKSREFEIIRDNEVIIFESWKYKII